MANHLDDGSTIIALSEEQKKKRPLPSEEPEAKRPKIEEEDNNEDSNSDNDDDNIYHQKGISLALYILYTVQEIYQNDPSLIKRMFGSDGHWEVTDEDLEEAINLLLKN